MIHLLCEPATPAQIDEMLVELVTYVKLAVDTRLGVLAGGGVLHADCEALLLAKGSQPRDVWGTDWYPQSREVGFESLINIRPAEGNRSLEIVDPLIRAEVERIVRTLLDIP